MRILILTEYFPNQFKPYFETQFVEFIRRGHDIRIFAHGKWDSTLNPDVRKFALDSRTTYYPTRIPMLARFLVALVLRLVASPRQVVRVLAKAPVRHAGVKRNLLNVARAVLLPAAPPDAVLMHDLATTAYFLFLRRLYPGVPITLYYHGGEIPQGGRTTDDDARTAFEMLDRVFTNTQYSRGLAIRRGCPPEKIVITPVGFRLDEYDAPRSREYRKNGILRLVAVGRLSAEKGHKDIFQAMAELGRRGVDVRLRIIGDGPLRRSLEDVAARTNGTGQIEFLGVVPKQDVIRQLAAADVLVLASVPLPAVEENQACVLQEAMLMGVVVVTTRVGGVQESIPETMRQLSVAPHDSVAMADSLERIARAPDPELVRLAETGREFVVRNYEISAVTSVIENCLRETPRSVAAVR